MSPARRRGGTCGGMEPDVTFAVFARFSRNIAGYPFPWKNRKRANAISQAVSDALEREFPGCVRADDTSAAEEALPFCVPPDHGASILSLRSRGVLVAVNGSDHLAVCGTGPDIGSAYESACGVEAALGRHLSFAWRPDIGYLTASPSDVGTGLKAGAVMHLEGLHLLGELEPCMRGLEAMRMMAQGIDVAGIRQAGHIYRVMNSVTLGEREERLVERSVNAVATLVEQELNARTRLVEELPRVFSDAVCRALAILKSARLLSPAEALDLLSPVRLAASMGFLSGITSAEADRMMRGFPIFEPEDPDVNRRDEADGKLADRINRRFARVVPNRSFIETMP